MNKGFDIVRSYLITIALLFGVGMVWTIAKYELDIIRFVGIFMAVGACSVINLIYFLPTKKLSLLLLTPGILSILIFLLIQGSNVERTFFTSFGIINLLIGIMWLIIMSIRK
jgi:hypothetical protein